MRTHKESSWFILLWLIAVLTVPAGSYAASFIVLSAAFIYTKRKGAPFVSMRKPNAVLVLCAFGLGVFVIPSGLVISYLSSIFESSSMVGIESRMAEQTLLESMVIFAIIPAVTEELVCRGAALDGYRDVKTWKAVLLNGLIFGVMHGNLRQFFYTFYIGALIALIVIYSGSVLYGVIIHFTINGLQTALNYIPGEFTVEGWVAAVLTVASSFGCVWLMKVFKTRRVPTIAAEPSPRVLNAPLTLFFLLGTSLMIAFELNQ